MLHFTHTRTEDKEVTHPHTLLQVSSIIGKYTVARNKHIYDYKTSSDTHTSPFVATRQSGCAVNMTATCKTLKQVSQELIHHTCPLLHQSQQQTGKQTPGAKHLTHITHSNTSSRPFATSLNPLSPSHSDSLHSLSLSVDFVTGSSSSPLCVCVCACVHVCVWLVSFGLAQHRMQAQPISGVE